MSAKREAPLVVNGWSLYAHPLILGQIQALIEEVEDLERRYPEKYKKKNATKRLAAIRDLIFVKIPMDPASPVYRQGSTLGKEHSHWFRGKFFQQYRLFFRYDLARKIIVYAWVNDDDTLRAYGSKSDAYAVFKSMLDSNKPPSDWDSLLTEAKNHQARFQAAKGGI